ILLQTLMFVLSFLAVSVCAGQEVSTGDTQGSQYVEVLRGSTSYDIVSATYTVRADAGEQATISIGSRTITADYIEFNENNQIFYAEGDVKLWDQGNIYRGSRAKYFLDRQYGWMEDVQRFELSPDVYFSGELLEYSQVPARDALPDATGEV